jgi:hypothetical protein
MKILLLLLGFALALALAQQDQGLMQEAGSLDQQQSGSSDLLGQQQQQAYMETPTKGSVMPQGEIKGTIPQQGALKGSEQQASYPQKGLMAQGGLKRTIEEQRIENPHEKVPSGRIERGKAFKDDFLLKDELLESGEGQALGKREEGDMDEDEVTPSYYYGRGFGYYGRRGFYGGYGRRYYGGYYGYPYYGRRLAAPYYGGVYGYGYPIYGRGLYRGVHRRGLYGGYGYRGGYRY